MTHYTYSERSQPRHRQHLGPLEKHKDAKKRLLETRILKKEEMDVRSEIKQQTGNEYFAAMKHSRKQKNKIVFLPKERQKKRGYSLNNTKYYLTDDEKKTLRYVDLEISATKSKLEFISVPRVISKITFDDKGNKEKVIVSNLNNQKEDDSALKLENYLKELYDLKQNIYKKYE